MFKLKFVLLFFLLFCSYAYAKQFAVGGIVGIDYTGLTLKVGKGVKTSVDFQTAWDFSKAKDKMILCVDYTVNNNILHNSNLNIPFYYGAGLKFSTYKDNVLGIRAVLGFTQRLSSLTNDLEIFLELAPVFNLVSKTDFNFDAGIGAKYYFSIN